MAKDFTVTARLQAVDNASAVVRKVDSSFDDLADGLSSRFAVSAAAATAAIAGMVTLLRDSVAAASEAAEGVKKLDNALSDIGPSGSDVSDALQRQAAALQKVTAFSDDAIIKGQALAASFIKSEETLRRVTEAAADFASGRGLDIGTAFELLTKASQGSTETLSRYGIVLDDSIPKGERFSAVLALINDRFGGRAAADAQTYAGAVAQVGNAFGEVQEALGRIVTESDATNQTLRDIAAGLNQVAEGSSDTSKGFDVIGIAVKAANDAFEGQVPLLAALVEGFRALQEERAREAQSQAAETAARDRALKTLKEVTDEQVRTAKNLTTLSQVLGTTTKAWDALSAAEEREKRISGEIVETQESLGEAASRLGVTLRTNVLNAIEENNQALERFREGLRLGLVSQEEFIRAQQATEAANRALLDSTDGQTTAQAAANEEYRNGTARATEYAAAVRGTVVPALQLAQEEAARAAAGIAGVFDRSGNAISGVVGFSQGGTRAELAGGGSRLVGRVGGTFGSQVRLAGDATYIADPLTGRIERVG